MGRLDERLEDVHRCEVVPTGLTSALRVKGLRQYDLSGLGYDAQLLGNAMGVLVVFVYEQYAYLDQVCARVDDVVIDCGGATGDSAVYFAAKGASDVYVFEFVRSSMEVIDKQIALNSAIGNRITVVNRPVWSDSNVEFSYLDRGNSSRVAEAGLHPNSVKSLSIDDMVSEYGLRTVDLVKMDIEGAEVPAIEGARDTIGRYKPKLAICAYHKADDLIAIPQLLASLNPGYKFYFDYYTDFGWEAVLYAIDERGA